MKKLIIAGICLSLIGCSTTEKVATGAFGAAATTVATASNIVSYPIRLVGVGYYTATYEDYGFFDLRDGVYNFAVPIIQPLYTLGAYWDLLDGSANFSTPAYNGFVPITMLSEFYETESRDGFLNGSNYIGIDYSY